MESTNYAAPFDYGSGSNCRTVSTTLPLKPIASAVSKRTIVVTYDARQVRARAFASGLESDRDHMCE